MTDSKKLTAAEVQHIARLARLPLSDDEISRLAAQLSETTNYINVLQELNTTDILPTAQVNHKKNVFRSDEIQPSLTQQQALSTAKDTFDGFFKTEATITKNNH
ncbi:Asp-tRNA(Asn)/Glu-tRNA(Gln) amidotransferase subunit GatC [Patescibacteria group bacterium]|nr:Asp-tRNA(Asn)/Glu-tRNA(Gln) amidotransferase subunit GatC [Patescibacteria group bacterium]